MKKLYNHTFLLISFGILIFFMIISTYFIFTLQKQNSNQLEESIIPAMDARSMLLMHLINQETGIRGYIASSETDYLEPFSMGKIEAKINLNNLKTYLKGYPELNESLEEKIIPLLNDLESYFNTQIDYMKGEKSEIAVTRLEFGKSKMDEFRTLDKELAEQLDNLRNELMMRNNRLFTIERNILFIGSILLSLIFLYTLILSKLLKKTQGALLKENKLLEKKVENKTKKLLDLNDKLLIEIDNHLLTQTKLVATMEKVKQVNVEKSNFFIGMSHDLRTPLNSIIGYSHILLSDEQKILDDTQRHMVSRILNGGQYLLDLISDILDVAKIEEKQLKVETKPIFIEDVVEEAINSVYSQLKQKKITLNNKMGNVEEKKIIVGDNKLLKRVFINILTNSIKYNDYGGSITLTCTKQKNTYLLCIQDDGIGIPKEKLSDVFQLYYRMPNLVHTIEGSGIGLFLVKNYLQLMGASCYITNNSKKGISFWIEYPMISSNN